MSLKDSKTRGTEGHRGEPKIRTSTHVLLGLVRLGIAHLDGVLLALGGVKENLSCLAGRGTPGERVWSWISGQDPEPGWIIEDGQVGARFLLCIRPHNPERVRTGANYVTNKGKSQTLCLAVFHWYPSGSLATATCVL